MRPRMRTLLWLLGCILVTGMVLLALPQLPWTATKQAKESGEHSTNSESEIQSLHGQLLEDESALHSDINKEATSALAVVPNSEPDIDPAIARKRLRLEQLQAKIFHRDRPLLDPASTSTSTLIHMNDNNESPHNVNLPSKSIVTMSASNPASEPVTQDSPPVLVVLVSDVEQHVHDEEITFHDHAQDHHHTPETMEVEQCMLAYDCRFHLLPSRYPCGLLPVASASSPRSSTVTTCTGHFFAGGVWLLPCKSCSDLPSCDWNHSVWQVEDCDLNMETEPQNVVLEYHFEPQRHHLTETLCRDSTDSAYLSQLNLTRISYLYVLGDSTLRYAFNGLLQRHRLRITPPLYKESMSWTVTDDHVPFPMSFTYRHIGHSRFFDASEYWRQIDLLSLAEQAFQRQQLVLILVGGNDWRGRMLLVSLVQSLHDYLGDRVELQSAVKFVLKGPQFSMFVHRMSTQAFEDHVRAVEELRDECSRLGIVYVDTFNMTLPAWRLAKPFDQNCFCHYGEHYTDGSGEHVYGPVNDWIAVLLERALCSYALSPSD